MDKQVRYIVDPINHDNISNKIVGEPHRLEDKRFKCLAPLHGSFYADSIRIVQDKTFKVLKHNKDYVYSDLDVETSTLLGRPVANVIIITNNKLGRDFILNYNAVGLSHKEVNKRTVALLQAPDDGPVSDSYIDLRNKPLEFLPTFHYQSLSDIENFEYLLFYLEKLRVSIVFESSKPIREYLQHIETVFNVLLERSTGHFMTVVEIKFNEIREHFNKTNFNVNLIPNLDLLNFQATYNVATGTDKRFKPDGLLAMKALASFKAGIYDVYLGGDTTILGKDYGVVIPPIIKNYYDLVIGATVIIDSYSNNTNKNIMFDRLAYPNVKRSNSKFNIKKIVNDLDKRCVIVATEFETYKVYTGVITKSNLGYLIEWREIVRPTAINTSILDVGAHLANRNNPHRDNKNHIDLNLVENIPVAKLLDILTDSTERKYLKWDILDKYMKRFLLKRRPHKTDQLEDKDENLMRNISVVFSQCGSDCKSSNQCHVIEPVYTTPIPTTTQIFTTTTTTTTTRLPTTTTTTTLAPIKNGYIGIYSNAYSGGQLNYNVKINYTSTYLAGRDAFKLNDLDIWFGVRSSLFKFENELITPTYYNLTNTDTIEIENKTPELNDGFTWKHSNFHSNIYFTKNYNESEDQLDEAYSNYRNELENNALFIPMKIYDLFNKETVTNLTHTLEIIGFYDNVTPIEKYTNEGSDFTYYCKDFDYRLKTDITEEDKELFFSKASVNIRSMFSYDEEDINKKEVNGFYLLVKASDLITSHGLYTYTTNKGVVAKFRLSIYNGPINNRVVSGIEFTVAVYSAKFIEKINGVDISKEFFSTVVSILNIVPLTFRDEEKHELCVLND